MVDDKDLEVRAIARQEKGSLVVLGRISATILLMVGVWALLDSAGFAAVLDLKTGWILFCLALFSLIWMTSSEDGRMVGAILLFLIGLAVVVTVARAAWKFARWAWQ